MRRRSGNNITFNDMLFNILLGFVVLFVIAFLLINPITKRNDIPAKVELMIVVEWEDRSLSDIDIWVQYNDVNPTGFNNRESNGINLERDDLGQQNDKIVVDGETILVYSNREVVNIRGIMPGDYYINLHSYSFRDNKPLVVKVTVIDINPIYREAYTLEYEFVDKNSIHRPPAFTVDPEGHIVDIFAHTRTIVPVRRNFQQ